jgi:hypothetical protein
MQSGSTLSLQFVGPPAGVTGAGLGLATVGAAAVVVVVVAVVFVVAVVGRTSERNAINSAGNMKGGLR